LQVDQLLLTRAFIVVQSFGQLGLNDKQDRNAPVQVPFFSTGADIKHISTGFAHSVAVLGEANDIYIWGKNEFGQLGLNDNANRAVPTKLVLKSSQSNNIPIKSIIGIGFHNFILSTTGRVWAWGRVCIHACIMY